MTNSDKPIDDIERYLAGDSDLSRLYREARTEQPSSQFEQAILSAAHETAALRGQTRTSMGSRFWAWLDRARVPVATTASMALVLGVVIGVYREHGMNIPTDLETPVPAAAPATAAPEPEPAEDAGSARSRAQVKAPPPKMAVEKKIAKKPAASVAEAPAVADSDLAKRQELKDTLSKSSAPGSDLGVPPAAPLAEEARAPMRSKTESSPVTHGTTQSNESAQGIAPEAKAKKDARSLGASLMPPEAWLQKIESLFEQKNLNDARRELQAFKQAYPAYDLPERVKKLDSQ